MCVLNIVIYYYPCTINNINLIFFKIFEIYKKSIALKCFDLE